MEFLSFLLVMVLVLFGLKGCVIDAGELRTIKNKIQQSQPIQLEYEYSCKLTEKSLRQKEATEKKNEAYK